MPTPPPASPHAHFTDLDGMRGILALQVMAVHLGLTPFTAWATRHVLTDGQWQIAVDFFFVLSGFVLYFSLERTRPTLQAYFVKRVRRLYPMALIGTLAMIAVTRQPWSGPQLAANLVLLHTMLPQVYAINQPEWGIPPELFMPALFLPMVGYLARIERRVLWVLLAVFGFGMAVGITALLFRLSDHLVRAAFGLAFGMVLGRLRKANGPTTPRPVLALGAFAACLVLMAVTGRLWLAATLLPVAIALAVYHGAQTRTFLSRAPFQALGRWSFSIYLLHMPIIEAVALLVGPVNGDAPRKLLVAVLTMALAAFCWRFIERPLMQGRAAPAYPATNATRAGTVTASEHRKP